MRTRPVGPPAWLLDAGCVAALLAATAACYPPLLRGVAPLSNDHNFHLLNLLEQVRLLRAGRLTGWSDAFGVGQPQGVLYPFAGYLPMAALDLAGVPLQVAYALGLLGVLALGPIATFLAGRLHVSRTAGLLAGLATLLDPGGSWVGGHAFTMRIGVWPSAAAAALALAGLALAPVALRSRRPLAQLACGALLGLAVLIHPLALLLEASLAPFLLGAMLLAPAAERPASGVRGLATVALTAIAACAFWLVPFLAARRFVDPFLLPPRALRTDWANPAWLAGCALLLLRRPGAFRAAAAVCAPVLLVASSAEAIAVLARVAPGLPRLAATLQLLRLEYLLRPLAFLGAADVLAAAAGWALARVPRRARALAPAAGAAALLALVLVARPREPVPAGLTPPERRELEHALDVAARALQPGDRLALLAAARDHRLVGPAVLRGFPIVKLGDTATVFFRTRLAVDDPDAFWTPERLGRVGATVLLSRGEPPPALAGLPPLDAAEGFQVRAVPRRSRAWLERAGTDLPVLTWAAGQVRVEVPGAAGADGVRLALGYYDAWRADGATVRAFDWWGWDLTTVPARPGALALTYRAPARETAGWITSALAAALALVLAARPGATGSRPARAGASSPAP